jgi:hypothetical protein
MSGKSGLPQAMRLHEDFDQTAGGGAKIKDSLLR